MVLTDQNSITNVIELKSVAISSALRLERFKVSREDLVLREPVPVPLGLPLYPFFSCQIVGAFSIPLLYWDVLARLLGHAVVVSHVRLPFGRAGR